MGSWAQMTLAPNLNNIDSFYSEIMHLYCNDFSYYNIKPSQISSSNSSDSLYFQGLLCHIDDACTSNPCKMGAQCDTNPVNGRFNCNCPSGYKGSTCADDIDECVIGETVCRTFVCLCLSMCLCIYSHLSLHTHYSVLCISYFANTLFFGTSGPNPCEHGGSCQNTEGSFSCNCAPGYTGPRCEQDINECGSNPCQNDATCLDQIGGYTCICMPGTYTHTHTHTHTHTLITLIHTL